MNRRLAGNAVRVAAISGLVGSALLLQESALAYRFGVSDSLASFQIAFLWVSLLWNVLAGGTLVQVLVPTYVWARTHLGAETASNALATLSGSLVAGMTLVSVALGLLVPMLFGSRLLGLESQDARLAGALFAVMAPTFILQTLAAIAQARLNVDGRFALAAFTPIFAPLAAAAATLTFAEDWGVFAPAAGVLAGQAVQAALLMAALPAHQKLRLRGASFVTHLPSVRSFFVNYGLLVSAALMLGGVSWVDQAVAAHLGADAVAHLAYANRPVFLFAAFATIAVANVALPGFTEHAARRDHKSLEAQLKRGVLWIAGMSIVALPVWGLLTPQLVVLLYERGAFSATDTATVSVLQRWSLGQIPFYLVATLAWRMLNALQANGFVLAATAGCFAINLALTVPLAAAAGVRGILAGTTLAFAAWCLVLSLGVWRRLR